MEVVTKLIYDNLIVKLIGELDECTADYTRRTIDMEIARCNINCVTFDLQDLSFMDSTGIGVLLGRYKIIKKLGGVVQIRGCNNHIDKVLSMSGIFRIMKKIS